MGALVTTLARVDGHLELLHGVASRTLTLTVEIPSSHPSVVVLGSSRQGSAVLVEEPGYLLTVHYVVLGARTVLATDIAGRTYKGSVVAQDFGSGLAVVKLEEPALPASPVRRGTSTRLECGVDVLTVASVGEAERRAAWGSVSSLEPLDAYWEYRLDRCITVTFINPGLGGGPLCTSDGRLVGLCSLNLGTLGRATMAIPAECFYDYQDELLENGRRVTRAKRAWVGMFCHAFPDRTVVAGLIPGGPGERSGLEVGDILMDIDGEQIVSRSHLYERLWSFRPGDEVPLSVARGGSLQTITVVGGDVEEFFRA